MVKVAIWTNYLVIVIRCPSPLGRRHREQHSVVGRKIWAREPGTTNRGGEWPQSECYPGTVR